MLVPNDSEPRDVPACTQQGDLQVRELEVLQRIQDVLAIRMGIHEILLLVAVEHKPAGVAGFVCQCGLVDIRVIRGKCDVARHGTERGAVRALDPSHDDRNPRRPYPGDPLERRVEAFTISEELDPSRAANWILQIEDVREQLIVNVNRKITTDALFLTMAGEVAAQKRPKIR